MGLLELLSGKVSVRIATTNRLCAQSTLLPRTTDSTFVTSGWSCFSIVAVGNDRGHQVGFHCSFEGVELSHSETVVLHGTDERRTVVNSFWHRTTSSQRGGGECCKIHCYCYDLVVVWSKLPDQIHKKTWANKLQLWNRLYSLKLR